MVSPTSPMAVKAAASGHAAVCARAHDDAAAARAADPAAGLWIVIVLWFKPIVSGVIKVRPTSHVTRHTSHVTRHTSHVTRHTSTDNISRPLLETQCKQRKIRLISSILNIVNPPLALQQSFAAFTTHRRRRYSVVPSKPRTATAATPSSPPGRVR